MAGSCAVAPWRFSTTTFDGSMRAQARLGLGTLPVCASIHDSVLPEGDEEKAFMENCREDSHESEVTLAATWEGRMRQVAHRELPYEQALRVALDCVEVAERYASSQPESMSPAAPDAKLDVVVNLASALECDVRLAVYSLYHGDKLLEHDKAVEKLLQCGKRSDT